MVAGIVGWSGAVGGEPSREKSVERDGPTVFGSFSARDQTSVESTALAGGGRGHCEGRSANGLRAMTDTEPSSALAT